jgi:hypothetical protein
VVVVEVVLKDLREIQDLKDLRVMRGLWRGLTAISRIQV